MQLNDTVYSENNTYKIVEMCGASDAIWVRLVSIDFISPEVLGEDVICTAVRQSKWVSESVVRGMTVCQLA